MRWLKQHGSDGWAPIGILASVAGIGVLVWVGITHPIHPNGDIDYGNLAVAVGTLILATFTLGSVLLGWRALKDTRAEIGISREALEVSRQELEATQRPVVVVALDDSKKLLVPDKYGYPVDADQEALEAHIGYLGDLDPWSILARPSAFKDTLIVPIRNIGVGPALDVGVRISMLDPEIRPQNSGLTQVTWIAAGEWLAVGIPVPDISAFVPSFDVQVRFADLAGKYWVTSARYLQKVDGQPDRSYYEPKIHSSRSDDPNWR